jgi:Berberine and berberine like
LPSQAIGALAAHLAAERVPGQDRSVIFAPWGGSYNRQSPHATAFPHRSQLFLLEYLVLSPAGASAAANRAAHQWVTKSWASVYPCATPRVYPNFPDPELTDPARAYYGDNYPRLRAIKARYDPAGVFGDRRPGVWS